MTTTLPIALPKRGPIPLGRLIEYYLATEFIGMSPGYLFQCQLALEKFEVFVGARSLITRDKKVALPIYQEWIANQFGCSQSSTATKTTGIIVGFLNFLVRHGILETNNHSLVKRPRLARKPPRPCITIEEYERLKVAALDGRSNQYWLIVAGWNTGQSWIDCCLLKHSDVDLDAMQLTVVRQKMKRISATAKIPIKPGSDFHLALLGKLERKEGVWPNEPEKGVHYLDTDLATLGLRSINGQGMRDTTGYRRVCARAGVDHRKTFHSFRATLSTGLVNSGINPIVACQITGHTSVASMMRYATVSDEATRGAMAKFRLDQAMQQSIGKPPELIPATT